MSENLIKISPKTTQKLKDMGVGLVYLFGSRAEGTAHPLSDFDIGIVLSDKKKLQEVKKRPFQMGAEFDNFFEEVVPSTFKNPVQVTFLQIASFNFQFNAIKYGKVLFEISSEFRADYEEKVMREYLEFKPYYNEFYQATLDIIG